MKQPIFYPGKKLCAEDLISLEEYAFSRVNIVSPGHGVVDLYTGGKRPEQKKSKGNRNYFFVRQVKGITPEGRPIDFKTEQNNGKRMALKLEYPSKGVCTWDIYIDDMHPKKKENVNEYSEKYKLSYQSVNAETEPPEIPSNKLYIGRYKLMADEPPEIVSPPYLYSFASFNFPSREWWEWTLPIREALRIVAKRHNSECIAVLVKHILYNYPFWPLSQLLKASNQLAWLCTESDLENALDEGSIAALQDSQVNNLSLSSLYNLLPIEIPKKIGAIIGSLVENLWTLVPPQQYSFSENLLVLDKAFFGKYEVKFKFNPDVEVDEYAKLKVDNFFDFVAPRFEEPDLLNNMCYCYLIEYSGTAEEKFTLMLPKKWKKESFKIYYRTLVESK